MHKDQKDGFTAFIWLIILAVGIITILRVIDLLVSIA